MATRNVGKVQSGHMSTPLEQIEKSSSTLKRHPKMELSKPDLLQLLGVLEGELQAREIVIAVLKAEQVKQLLYPSKKSSSTSDPWSALQRDSFGAFDATFDEATVKGLYSMQLAQLENFIRQQRNAQSKLREELQDVEERYAKLVSELEDEKRKHAQDTAQGDDVTYLLEKERERLKQEVEFERQQNRCLEKDIKCLTETIEQERLRQKQIVLLLLAERKRLILRFVEEKQKCDRITQLLCDEKGRIADMVDGLEEESKKSLQMEAEMERQLCEFEVEREQFKMDLTLIESKNHELRLEVQRLQEELENARKQVSSAALLSSQAQLGEGVRSTIVTMVSTPAIRAVPTISPTVSPPRGVARAVSPKTGPAPATPAKPPGLIPQLPAKIATAPPPKPLPATLSTSVVSSPVSATSGTPLGTKGTSRPGKASSPIPLTSPVVQEGENPLPQATIVAEVVKGGSVQFIENVLSPPDASEKGVVTLGESNIQQSQKALSGPKLSTAQGSKLLISMPVSSLSVAKKQLPLGRGAPPPIPPNKPVLPPQALHRKEMTPRPPVPPRTELNAELTAEQKSQKPGVSGARFGVVTSKVITDDGTNSGLTTGKEETQVGVITEVGITTTTDNQLSTEVLGQELADFQQILVSMVTSKVANSLNHND